MNTKKKNIVKSLLEIRAEFHHDTFGRDMSWKISRTSQNPGGQAKWHIDIIESHDSGSVTSHNYDVIGKIAEVAMVSSFMDGVRDGKNVMRFHLY